MPRGTNQLDKEGMTPDEKKEAKKAMVLAGRLQWWRHLMNEGLDHKAEHYATTYSLHELVEGELAAMKKFKAVLAENPAPVVPEAESPAAYEAEEKLITSLIDAAKTLEVRPGVIAEMNAVGEALEQESLAAAAADAVQLKDGWPVRAEAVVEKYPINPKMVVAVLPDGREVRLWNDGPRRWKLGSKVKVKIEEAGAEPIYVGDFDE